MRTQSRWLPWRLRSLGLQAAAGQGSQKNENIHIFCQRARRSDQERKKRSYIFFPTNFHHSWMRTRSRWLPWRLRSLGLQAAASRGSQKNENIHINYFTIVLYFKGLIETMVSLETFI
jgi:hypothetical protein